MFVYSLYRRSTSYYILSMQTRWSQVERVDRAPALDPSCWSNQDPETIKYEIKSEMAELMIDTSM